MTELILMIAVITFAGVAMFGLLPWAARAGATAALFSYREELYDCGDRAPKIRRTVLYRDIEYYVGAAIQLCRDQPTWDVVMYALHAHSPLRREQPLVGWMEERKAQYDKELAEATEDELGALQDAAAQFRSVQTMLGIRAVLGSPLVLMAFLVLLPWLTLRLLTQQITWTTALSRAVVVRIDKVEPPRPWGARPA